MPWTKLTSWLAWSRSDLNGCWDIMHPGLIRNEGFHLWLMFSCVWCTVAREWRLQQKCTAGDTPIVQYLCSFLFKCCFMALQLVIMCQVNKRTFSCTISSIIWADVCFIKKKGKKRKKTDLQLLVLGAWNISFRSCVPCSKVLWIVRANLPASSALMYLQGEKSLIIQHKNDS